MKKFMLILLSKIFHKLWMPLLLLCLGAILLAPSCPASCQPSSSPPPSSGSVVAVWSHLSSRYDGPYIVLRRGPRSFTIRIRPRDEIIAISRLKACTAADAELGCPRRHGRPLGLRQGGPAATKWVSFSDLLVSTPSPLAPPRDGPGTVFLPSEEVFAHPGPAPPSQVPPKRYPSCQQAPPQRLDL
jgi:hypothetical protein